TRIVSWVSDTDGDDAIALKLFAVRNVSSLMKSNPRVPGLAVVPVMRMSMNDVLISFQALNDACISARAAATERNAAPSGLGIGSSVVLMLNWTGIALASHLMPITRARIC